MKKANTLILIFYFSLILVVSTTLFYINSSLEQPTGQLKLVPEPLSEISFTKTIKINKEQIFNTMADYQNFPKVLPQNVVSIESVATEKNTHVYKIEMIEKGIKTKLLVSHTILPLNEQIIKVLDGDAKDTVIIQKFEEQGEFTTLTTKANLKLSGILTPFKFLPIINFNHALETIVSSFVNYSIEKTKNEKIVDDLYREILKRPADLSGLEHFSSLLDNKEITSDEIRNELLNSDEYKSVILRSNIKQVDELNDNTKKFIDDLYLTILRRHVDVEGLQYFGSLLESNSTTKETIRDELIMSKEFISLPVETRSLDIVRDEYQEFINATHYQVYGKYADKKTIRVFGVFLESGEMTTSDVHNFFSNQLKK